MSEENTFSFELVSPERKLLSEDAWQVTIPGEEGTFGVRAGHCSLVSSIRPGVVEVVSEEGAEAKKIFIAGGFADVTATNCTVLAEEAVSVDDLNKEEVEQDIRNLGEDLGRAKDDVSKARIEKTIEVTKAKLTAITGTLAA